MALFTIALAADMFLIGQLCFGFCLMGLTYWYSKGKKKFTTNDSLGIVFVGLGVGATLVVVGGMVYFSLEGGEAGYSFAFSIGVFLFRSIHSIPIAMIVWVLISLIREFAKVLSRK